MPCLKGARGQVRKSGSRYTPGAGSQHIDRLDADGQTLVPGFTIRWKTVPGDHEILTRVWQRCCLDGDGVTAGKLDFSDREEQQAESLRKMIPRARTPRCADQLADRLHNMRTLSFQPKEKQVQVARETLDIYAPIAHRLGVYTIKQEIEDLALRYIDPEGYRDVALKVGQKRVEREAQIQFIIDTLTEKIKEAGIHDFEIAGRPKHLYSIYRKMVIQNRHFDQIYDLIAVRVIVNTIPECYTVLGIVHTLWTYMPNRLKDYISVAKNNMYQSLHTTLVGGAHPTPFEVQSARARCTGLRNMVSLRTELQGRQQSDGLTKAVLAAANIDHSPKPVTARSSDGLEDRPVQRGSIHLTPKGDIINMQRCHAADATCTLRWAIPAWGPRSMAAVPLDTELETGDRVEILTCHRPKAPA